MHAAGAVTGKQYAAGTGQTFSYFAGRLPHEVSVARSTGGSLTYGYSTDGAKDLTSAAWPEVVSGVFTIPPATQGYGYDRAGRLRTIGDSSGNRTQAYQNGRLKATTWNSGLFAGNQLITDLDTSGRDCGFTLNRNGTTIHSATRVPNGVSGEISEVSSGGLTIVIKRNAARQITGFEWHPTDPTAPVVTQTWSRGSAGRILSARSSVVGSPSFDWINDQTKTLRISAASGARVWAGLAGGDLTEIPDFNLTGSSNLTLPSTQSSGWVPWHTLAMLPGEGEGTFGANAVYNPLASPDAKAEQFGAVWIPPVNETLAYDADGNRQSSALWDYGWDGRNKLVRARTKDYNISTTPQGYDVTCDYDAENRRCKKFVTTYQNGSITAQDHITFLWDGWDMIYERHQQPSGLTTLERKYVWGPDLSGSHGGAGGAGGLLLIRETRGTQTKDYYPLYDGCGHVIALADSNGNLVAEYAYGPFGELIHANGPMAQAIPIRYATKYFDSEMGLYYFGQRYLDPITNQWLSREPLGEGVSVNLYSYCHSDPINKVDMQGLEEVVVGPVLRKGIPTMIYQDWEGTGLEYLWNAVGWGNVTQPERRPTAEQLAINFYQEDGVWHLASEGARHNAGMAAAMAAVPGKMEEIKKVIETLEKGGAVGAILPAGIAAGSLEVGGAALVYGESALASAAATTWTVAGYSVTLGDALTIGGASWLLGTQSGHEYGSQVGSSGFSPTQTAALLGMDAIGGMIPKGGSAAKLGPETVDRIAASINPPISPADDIATLKSIRRYAERLVQGKVSSSNPATMMDVRAIQSAIANSNYRGAGTGFHSLNFSMARNAQSRGFLQNLNIDKVLSTPGGILSSRRPDYLFKGGEIYDIKPFRPSPSAYDQTMQFQDIQGASGIMPIPLYYRLW